MKTEYITLYGIELRCFFEQDADDGFDPQSGHYTTPGKWMLVDVEHKLESIYELMDDKLLYTIKSNFNAKQHA